MSQSRNRLRLGLAAHVACVFNRALRRARGRRGLSCSPFVISGGFDDLRVYYLPAHRAGIYRLSLGAASRIFRDDAAVTRVFACRLDVLGHGLAAYGAYAGASSGDSAVRLHAVLPSPSRDAVIAVSAAFSAAARPRLGTFSSENVARGEARHAGEDEERHEKNRYRAKKFISCLFHLSLSSIYPRRRARRRRSSASSYEPRWRCNNILCNCSGYC